MVLGAGQIGHYVYVGGEWVQTIIEGNIPAAIFEPMTLSFLDSKEYDKHFWQDYYEYNGDKFAKIGNRNFLLRDGNTYELIIGQYQMNGLDMERYMVQATAGGAEYVKMDKEFARIHINSNVKPDDVSFYDSLEDFRADTKASSMNQATQGDLYLKDYRGWEQGIPRKTAGNRNRQQGRFLIYKISKTSNAPFQIKSVVNEFKILK